MNMDFTVTSPRYQNGGNFDSLEQYIGNSIRTFKQNNRDWSWSDPLREGAAGLIQQFAPSDMETERLKSLVGLDDNQFIEAVRAGNVKREEWPLGNMPRERRDALLQAQIVNRQNWKENINAASDYAAPTPHREPEGILENVGYHGLKMIPGALQSAAEFHYLTPFGWFFKNILIGNQNSQEQVYHNLRNQGKSHQEAYDEAMSAGSNLADLGIRGVSNFATMHALNSPITGNPIAQTLGNIGRASIYSGAGAAGEHALTNYRSNIDNEPDDLLKTGLIAGATTGAMGLINMAFNWRNLRELQNEYNRNKPIDADWRDLGPKNDEPPALGMDDNPYSPNNPNPPDNMPPSGNSSGNGNALALPQQSEASIRLNRNKADFRAKWNDAVTKRGFAPVTDDASHEASAKQVWDAVFNGDISPENAVELYSEAGMSPEAAQRTVDGIIQIRTQNPDLLNTHEQPVTREPQNFSFKPDWHDPLFPRKNNQPEISHKSTKKTDEGYNPKRGEWVDPLRLRPKQNSPVEQLEPDAPIIPDVEVPTNENLPAPNVPIDDLPFIIGGFGTSPFDPKPNLNSAPEAIQPTDNIPFIVGGLNNQANNPSQTLSYDSTGYDNNPPAPNVPVDFLPFIIGGVNGSPFDGKTPLYTPNQIVPPSLQRPDDDNFTTFEDNDEPARRDEPDDDYLNYDNSKNQIQNVTISQNNEHTLDILRRVPDLDTYTEQSYQTHDADTTPVELIIDDYFELISNHYKYFRFYLNDGNYIQYDDEKKAFCFHHKARPKFPLPINNPDEIGLWRGLIHYLFEDGIIQKQGIEGAQKFADDEFDAQKIGFKIVLNDPDEGNNENPNEPDNNNDDEPDTTKNESTNLTPFSTLDNQNLPARREDIYGKYDKPDTHTSSFGNEKTGTQSKQPNITVNVHHEDVNSLPFLWPPEKSDSAISNDYNPQYLPDIHPARKRVREYQKPDVYNDEFNPIQKPKVRSRKLGRKKINTISYTPELFVDVQHLDVNNPEFQPPAYDNSLNANPDDDYDDDSWIGQFQVEYDGKIHSLNVFGDYDDEIGSFLELADNNGTPVAFYIVNSDTFNIYPEFYRKGWTRNIEEELRKHLPDLLKKINVRPAKNSDDDNNDKDNTEHPSHDNDNENDNLTDREEPSDSNDDDNDLSVIDDDNDDGFIGQIHVEHDGSLHEFDVFEDFLEDGRKFYDVSDYNGNPVVMYLKDSDSFHFYPEFKGLAWTNDIENALRKELPELLKNSEGDKTTHTSNKIKGEPLPDNAILKDGTLTVTLGDNTSTLNVKAWVKGKDNKHRRLYFNQPDASGKSKKDLSLGYFDANTGTFEDFNLSYTGLNNAIQNEFIKHIHDFYELPDTANSDNLTPFSSLDKTKDKNEPIFKFAHPNTENQSTRTVYTVRHHPHHDKYPDRFIIDAEHYVSGKLLNTERFGQFYDGNIHGHHSILADPNYDFVKKSVQDFLNKRNNTKKTNTADDKPNTQASSEDTLTPFSALTKKPEPKSDDIPDTEKKPKPPKNNKSDAPVLLPFFLKVGAKNYRVTPEADGRLHAVRQDKIGSVTVIDADEGLFFFDGHLHRLDAHGNDLGLRSIHKQLEQEIINHLDELEHKNEKQPDIKPVSKPAQENEHMPEHDKTESKPQEISSKKKRIIPEGATLKNGTVNIGEYTNEDVLRNGNRLTAAEGKFDVVANNDDNVFYFNHGINRAVYKYYVDDNLFTVSVSDRFYDSSIAKEVQRVFREHINEFYSIEQNKPEHLDAPDNVPDKTPAHTPIRNENDNGTPDLNTAPFIEIAEKVKEHVINGRSQMSNKQLFDIADEAFGGTVAEGKYTVKDAYDAMELGINLAILELETTPASTENIDDVLSDLDSLNDLLQLIPTQRNRTDEQIEFQQFSTPPTLAYIVNWLANIQPDDYVLEPSAGVGSLAVFAQNSGANLILNELHPRRAALLEQLFGIKTHKENAEHINDILAPKIKNRPDIVIMNPPFSATAGRVSKHDSRNAMKHVEQALQLLDDGGRLVAILGQNMNNNSATYNKWWKHLKGKYNVRAILSIDGSNYKKFGTTFGNIIVIIDKNGDTTEGATFTASFKDLDEIIQNLTVQTIQHDNFEDYDDVVDEPDNDIDDDNDDLDADADETENDNDSYIGQFNNNEPVGEFNFDVDGHIHTFDVFADEDTETGTFLTLEDKNGTPFASYTVSTDEFSLYPNGERLRGGYSLEDDFRKQLPEFLKGAGINTSDNDYDYEPDDDDDDDNNDDWPEVYDINLAMLAKDKTDEQFIGIAEKLKRELNKQGKNDLADELQKFIDKADNERTNSSIKILEGKIYELLEPLLQEENMKQDALEANNDDDDDNTPEYEPKPQRKNDKQSTKTTKPTTVKKDIAEDRANADFSDSFSFLNVYPNGEANRKIFVETDDNGNFKLHVDSKDGEVVASVTPDWTFEKADTKTINGTVPFARLKNAFILYAHKHNIPHPDFIGTVVFAKSNNDNAVTLGILEDNVTDDNGKDFQKYAGGRAWKIFNQAGEVLASYAPRLDTIQFAYHDSWNNEHSIVMFEKMFRKMLPQLLRDSGYTDDDGNFIPDGNEAFRIHFFNQVIRDRKSPKNFSLPDNIFSDDNDKDNPLSWKDSDLRPEALRVYMGILQQKNKLERNSTTKEKKNFHQKIIDALTKKLHELFDAQNGENATTGTEKKSSTKPAGTVKPKTDTETQKSTKVVKGQKPEIKSDNETQQDKQSRKITAHEPESQSDKPDKKTVNRWNALKKIRSDDELRKFLARITKDQLIEIADIERFADTIPNVSFDKSQSKADLVDKVFKEISRRYSIIDDGHEVTADINGENVVLDTPLIRARKSAKNENEYVDEFNIMQGNSTRVYYVRILHSDDNSYIIEEISNWENHKDKSTKKPKYITIGRLVKGLFLPEGEKGEEFVNSHNTQDIRDGINSALEKYHANGEHTNWHLDEPVKLINYGPHGKLPQEVNSDEELRNENLKRINLFSTRPELFGLLETANFSTLEDIISSILKAGLPSDIHSKRTLINFIIDEILKNKKGKKSKTPDKENIDDTPEQHIVSQTKAGSTSNLKVDVKSDDEFKADALKELKEQRNLNVQDSDNDDEPTDASVFSTYRPAIKIKGAKEHPADLVESSAMASVRPPKVTYSPNLPDYIINEGRLSIAQLEAVTYAGQSFTHRTPNDERRGFFIGDGTGVGKGREISGVIMDQLRQGHGKGKAVWISNGHSLIKDAKRDWQGLGNNPDDIFAQENISDKKLQAHDEGIIFTAYSYFNGKSKGRIQQLKNWLGEDFDGVIVLDECHRANNSMTISEGGKKYKPSATALGISDFVKAFPNARVLYVSATGATDVRNLSMLDRLGLWGKSNGIGFADKTDFVTSISKGGVAAMEVVARDLKAMGLFISRTLSMRAGPNGGNEDVTFRTLVANLNEHQKAIYDKFAEMWQKIHANIEQALELCGDSSGKGGKGFGPKAMFQSYRQQFFNQVLVTLQTPATIRDMEAQLEKGNSVVIQLTNTFESAQDKAVGELQKKRNSGEDVDFDDLDISPMQLALSFLEKCFPINVMEEVEDENGNIKLELVLDSNGKPVINQEAVAMRDELIEEVKSIKSFTQSPIDMILDHFGHDNVAEITGRSVRFVLDSNGKRVEQKRNEKQIRAEIDDFNDGRKRILIFSGKGDTGASYHASNEYKNKQKRIHYLLQAGWRADKVIQGLGRTHRSNEAHKPEYVLVTTDVPGQKRFISTIARRLEQLGALTSGERKASANGLFSASDNLENKYVAYSLTTLFKNLIKGEYPEFPNPDEIFEQLAIDPDKYQEGLQGFLNQRGTKGNEQPFNKDEVTRFLNRVLGLTVDTQKKLWARFEDEINWAIEFARENGTLDMGTENINVVSFNVNKEEIVREASEFGTQTKYVELAVERTIKPRTWNEVKHKKGVEFYIRDDGVILAAVPRKLNASDIEAGVKNAFRLYFVNPMLYDDKSDYILNNQSAKQKHAYTKLSNDEAQSIWEKKVDEFPSTYTEIKHMITGVLLPVWKLIKSSTPRIQRIVAQNSDKVLGRIVPEKELQSTLSELGLGYIKKQNEKVNAKTLRAKLNEFDGAIAVLASGVELKYVRVNGHKRLEIINLDFYAAKKFVDYGDMLKEIINSKQRYFITDGSNIDARINRLLFEFPFVRMKNSSNISDDIINISDDSADNDPHNLYFVPPFLRPQSDPDENPYINSSPYAFENDETERRYQSSKKVKPQKLWDRILQFSEDVVKGFRSDLPELAGHKNLLYAQELLRKLNRERTADVQETVDRLRKALRHLNPDDFDLFSRAMQLEDLVETIQLNPDAALPWGLDSDSLDFEYARIKRLANLNPNVSNAIDNAEALGREITNELIKAADALHLYDIRNKLQRQHYFRHVVLDYFMQATGGSGAALKNPNKRGYLHHREGSEKDISSDWITAMGEVWTRMNGDIKILHTLKLLREHYDIAEELKKQAFEINMQNALDLIADSLRDSYNGNDLISVATGQLNSILNKKQASAISRLFKMAAKGDLPEGDNHEWAEIIYAMNTFGTLEALPTKYRNMFTRYIGWLAGLNDKSRPSATAQRFLRSDVNKRNALKNLLGDDFVTWQELIPDDYEIWSPVDSKLIFSANSVNENVLKIAEQNIDELLGIPLSELGQALNMGGDKQLWVIPSPLAKTLNDMGKKAPQGILAKAMRKINSMFKSWVLFSPVNGRVIKYNWRNFFGDFEAVLQGNPSALKFLRQAFNELKNSMIDGAIAKGSLAEFQKRGGALTAESRTELLNNWNELEEFAHLLEQKKHVSPLRMGLNFFKGYMKLATKLTEFREAILRYAAFLSYLELLQNNNGTAPFFGMSKPDEVNALDNLYDKAFKLANENLGAYDQISQNTRWLRDNSWLTFISWVEVNFRRSIQMYKNIWSGNSFLEYWMRKHGDKFIRMFGGGGNGNKPPKDNSGRGFFDDDDNSDDAFRKFFRRLRKLLGRSPVYLMRFAITLALSMPLMLILSIANWLNSENDNKLTPDIRSQPHLTLNTNYHTGEVLYLNRLGSAYDFFETVGLDNLMRNVKEFFDGRISFLEIANDITDGPVSKLVNNFNPLAKAAIELLTGKKLYPDIQHPEPIRDNWEYVAQSLALDWYYKFITGKPHVPFSDFSGSFASHSKQDEASYWYILDRKREFQEKKLGRFYDSFSQTKKGEALYNARRAAQYGDRKTMFKFLKEFYRAGGNDKGLDSFVNAAAPLYGLDEDEELMFIKWLPKDERKILIHAEKYYERMKDTLAF